MDGVSADAWGSPPDLSDRAAGRKLFHFHVSPLFVAIADLRPALPVSDMQFFAGFMGLCHALAGAAALWTESNRLRGPAKTAGPHQYYRVPGTEIRIASNHPIPTAAPIAAVLAATAAPD